MDALQRRVASGKLKAPEKIGAAAIPARNHGHRYYGWSYENGVFRFFEHPVHFTREQAYEGKYVIQTEEPNLSPVEAVRVHKERSEIERAFASLKDVIELRPIHHRTAECVQAHIFVASLALLIHRAIENSSQPGSTYPRPKLFLPYAPGGRAQVAACRRHRPRRQQQQTMRYAANAPRRRHPARAWHLCHQAANPAAARPNRSVETKRQTGMREINDLHAKKGDIG